MGKKSREKRERKLKKAKEDDDLLLQNLHHFSQLGVGENRQENVFNQQLKLIQKFLYRYSRLDAAIALCISELWPANIGSPIKHIFAWRILLQLEGEPEENKSITSYEDFRVFSEKLYELWPEFPMLEDFLSEADWGQIKTSLGPDFVPMFYGSCIERTPDFVEAFRITYAHIPVAQAHMDLVIALQAKIIESIPNLKTKDFTGVQRASVEVAPEDFWLACRPVLQQIGNHLKDWRDRAGNKLSAHFGAFRAKLSSSIFGNAVMQGEALPFIALEEDGFWLPMSIRSAPSVVIDYWAAKNTGAINHTTHQSLAQFVGERFRKTIKGPLTVFVGGIAYEGLPISCIVTAESGVHLICACDHTSVESLSSAAENLYAMARRGERIYFRRGDDPFFTLSRNERGPSADEIHIMLVVTQASTALSSVVRPVKPTRLLPLADFITIFDSLNDLAELQRYWGFIDSQEHLFGFFSPRSGRPVCSFQRYR